MWALNSVIWPVVAWSSGAGATVRSNKPNAVMARTIGSLSEMPSRCCAISFGPTRSTLNDSSTVRGVVSSMRQASLAMRRCCAMASDWSAVTKPVREAAPAVLAAMACKASAGGRLGS